MRHTAGRAGGALASSLRGARTFRATLIGAPGSGKGTQSEKLQKDYGIPCISTGNLLRQQQNEDGPLAQVIKEQMLSGGLVADDIVLQLVQKTLGAMEKEGWLLDGYPRNVEQAQQLDKYLSSIGQPLDFAMYIDVDKNLIADRLKDRRVHLPSGRTYHLTWSPPRVPDRDDVTGEPLVRRADDEPETVLARLQKYLDKTQPLLDYYKGKNLLISVHSPNSDVGYYNIQRLLSRWFID